MVLVTSYQGYSGIGDPHTKGMWRGGSITEERFLQDFQEILKHNASEFPETMNISSFM